jgi:TetR/AcrR family transcriptional regulator, repressor for uid operon
MPRERRVRKTNQTLIDARVQHILDAALRCFARVGFSAASMRDIAKEAGVSLGLLYRYFDDKAAIVGAAIKADSGEFRARLSAPRAQGLTGETLLAFLEREVALRSEATVFALTSEIVAEAARNPAIAALVRENIEAAERDLAEALQGLPGRAEPTPSALRQASHLLGLVDVLTMRAFLKLKAGPRETLRSALESPDP